MGCSAGFRKLGNGPCGDVGPLRKKKEEDCALSKSRICGSIGLSRSYSPHYWKRERERELKKTLDDCDNLD
jgi:hypothetical protein